MSPLIALVGKKEIRLSSELDVKLNVKHARSSVNNKRGE